MKREQLYTIRAHRYGGACKYAHNDVPEASAIRIVSALEEDGYDVDVTPPLPEPELTPRQAKELADRANERAVVCVVAAVCCIALLTVLFYCGVRAATKACNVDNVRIERNSK